MANRFWLVVVLASAALAAHAAVPSPPGLVSEGAWDWEKGVFTLTIRMPLPTDTEATPPKRRYLAEQEAQRHLQEEFVRRAGALPAASGKPLSDLMAADPTIEAGVAQLGEKMKFVSSRVDDGYTTLEMVWSVGLYDGLAPLLYDTSAPNEPPTLIRWAPSRDFSGIVIFAMGDLDWLGTGLQARWTPSLGFRLLNLKGEVVFDPTMVKPDYVQKWGQAGASLGLFNEERWHDRIGFDPLRLVARGVWGARPGDLILADADWERILSRDANRNLLAEGRVLVLYGPFPDYERHPNPDSAIDVEKPPVEMIPQPPPPGAAPARGQEGGAH